MSISLSEAAAARVAGYARAAQLDVKVTNANARIRKQE